MKRSVLPTISLSALPIKAIETPKSLETPILGSSRPTGKSLPSIDALTILKNVEKNKVKFSNNQINEIMSLNIHNNLDLLYEIICDCFSFYIESVDPETTIDLYIAMLKNYLAEQRTNSEIIFNSITFKDQKLQYDDDNNRMRRDVVIRIGSKCPYCKSTQTITVDAQLRGGDEGMASILKCYNCGRPSKNQ